MKLPTPAEIEALHRKYSPTAGVFELVYGHCRIVCEIALELGSRRELGVDLALVKAGTLLHDIGVYEFFDAAGNERRDLSYITHGVLGEAILQREGFPDEIALIASHHTGMGLSREDVTRHGWPMPAKDYMAETPEEELIMYSDKFHSKSKPPHFNSFKYYREHLLQFGEDKALKFDAMAEKFGQPDLERLSKKFGHSIR